MKKLGMLFVAAVLLCLLMGAARADAGPTAAHDEKNSPTYSAAYLL